MSLAACTYKTESAQVKRHRISQHPQRSSCQHKQLAAMRKLKNEEKKESTHIFIGKNDEPIKNIDGAICLESEGKLESECRMVRKETLSLMDMNQLRTQQ